MTVFASECTRINLRDCNFQKFPGGHAPDPLEWACSLYMHSYFLVTPPTRNPVSAPAETDSISEGGAPQSKRRRLSKENLDHDEKEESRCISFTESTVSA